VLALTHLQDKTLSINPERTSRLTGRWLFLSAACFPVAKFRLLHTYPVNNLLTKKLEVKRDNDPPRNSSLKTDEQIDKTSNEFPRDYKLKNLWTLNTCPEAVTAI
jgi:hypothetical protein